MESHREYFIFVSTLTGCGSRERHQNIGCHHARKTHRIFRQMLRWKTGGLLRQTEHADLGGGETYLRNWIRQAGIVMGIVRMQGRNGSGRHSRWHTVAAEENKNKIIKLVK